MRADLAGIKVEGGYSMYLVLVTIKFFATNYTNNKNLCNSWQFLTSRNPSGSLLLEFAAIFVFFCGSNN
jgi:hypothetical protein